jgi:predicted lipid-binding transport protein (Tim44 family)
MNRILTLAAVMLALTAWMAADVADARRLGGGRSFGAQRQMTPAPSTPNATPSAPANPAPSAAPRTATPATPAAAPSGMSRWLGPIAGIAAGLGLAALLSHFGLSEAFASFLLLGLLVVGGILLVRLFLARRTGAAPLQYAGASAERNRVEPQLGRGGSGFEPVMTGAPSAPSASRFPPGFDAVLFADQAKQQFRKLQAAYDNADRKALAEVMTPDMFAEVANDLAQRTSHEATVVDQLDAEVIDVTTEGKQHWMSVRFTGTLREDGAMLGKPFEETWNLVKPIDGSSGWMLAGIQQAHEMA